MRPPQPFTLGEDPANVVGELHATDADGEALGNWQIKGGDGAYKFAINPQTGRITIGDAASIDFVNVDSYDLIVMLSDGKLPSKDEVVTINIPTKVNVCHKGRKTLNISKVDVPDHLGHGDGIGRCVQ